MHYFQDCLLPLPRESILQLASLPPLLEGRITKGSCSLTDSSRKKMLMLDDSVLPRNRSNSEGVQARIYDHVSHQYLRGFICWPAAGRMASASFPWRLICSPLRTIGTVTKIRVRNRPSDEWLEGEDGQCTPKAVSGASHEPRASAAGNEETDQGPFGGALF